MRKVVFNEPGPSGAVYAMTNDPSVPTGRAQSLSDQFYYANESFSDCRPQITIILDGCPAFRWWIAVGPC
jgi:hypothetical protein